MKKITILTLLVVVLVSAGCQSSLVDNDEIGDIGITDESGNDIGNDISELESLTEDLEEIDEIDLTDILLNDF